VTDEARAAAVEALAAGDAEGAFAYLDAQAEAREAARTAEARFHKPSEATGARGQRISLPSNAELTLGAMVAAGTSEAEALHQLATGDRAAFEAEHAEAVKRAKEALVAKANAEADAEWAASPEGRQAAAAAAATAAEQRAKDAKNARLLAADENPSEDPSLWDRMSDTEILRFVGLETDPAVAAQQAAEAKAKDPAQQLLRARMDFADRYWQMAPADRPAAAAELGLDFAEFDAKMQADGVERAGRWNS
jgi:hypothetical protein